MTSRATRDVNNSFENKMKDHATLKELPKLILTCVVIGVAQRYLSICRRGKMLNALTKVITTLVGNKIIPTY